MTASTILRAGLVAALLALAGCSDIDFHDNPGRAVSRQVGPLTVPPADLRARTAS